MRSYASALYGGNVGCKKWWPFIIDFLPFASLKLQGLHFDSSFMFLPQRLGMLGL